MKSEKIMLVRNPKVAWQILDGKVVTVTAETKTIHVLYGCAGRIWEYVSEPRSIDEIVKMICEEYEVDQAQANRDIDAFIEEVKDKEIVNVKAAEEAS